tara:strand:- start:142 stop:819 length:678 start_codon:yes stop_codon:yes gene_type:complete
MQINLGTSLSGLRQVIAGDSVPTQWSDFPANFNELPPSYALVDQETDSYPNDYTGESNANVLTADDGNEVSATLSVPVTNTYSFVFGWAESNNPSDGLPASSSSENFLQSNVNNFNSGFTTYCSEYGEVTGSNSPTISNDKIVIRMKYSGDGVFGVDCEFGYFNHTSQSTTRFQAVYNYFSDFEIPSISINNSTLDVVGGFYMRLNILTFGTTTIHVDKISVVEV